MKQSITQAVKLATLATGQRVALYAEAGSPLEVLVRTVTTVAPDFSFVAEQNDAQQADAIAQFIETPIFNEVDDQLSGELVKSIATSVAGHVEYTRNVVVPTLKTYVDKVATYMDQAGDPFSSKFEIKIEGAPEIVNQLNFRTMVEGEAGGLLADPEAYVTMPEQTAEFILDKLTVGDAGYDQLIKDWAVRLGDAFLIKAWNQLFGRGDKKLLELFNDYGNGENYALFTYLITRRLAEDPPVDVELSLKDYKRYMSQYKDAAARQLVIYYQKQETIDKAGVLVLGANQSTYLITVNASVYKQYIANGGKNEAIFGSLLSGRISKSISELTEKGGEFIQIYEQYEAVNSARQRLNVASRLKAALKIEFVNLLAGEDIPDREKEAWLSFNLNRENLPAAADEVIDTVTTKDMDDLYDVCLRVLCRARYAYTDSEKFLRAMNQAAKANPNIDAREAALPALIELVADYVLAQIVKRNT